MVLKVLKLEWTGFRGQEAGDWARLEDIQRGQQNSYEIGDLASYRLFGQTELKQDGIRTDSLLENTSVLNLRHLTQGFGRSPGSGPCR